jgi:bla regulator protein BlaR1
MTAEFMVNHLWQSSCFALLAGLLALALRKNAPKVRYWVWLCASLKFLLPLAVLVSLGSMVPRPAQRVASVPAPVFTSALVQIAEPFPATSYATVPTPAPTHWAPVVISIVWTLGFVAIMLVRCRSWLRIRATLRASVPVELGISIPAFIAPGAAEPGIVGFLRPVLVLPAGMLEHLNARQLDAVLAHELYHVRRRDNLFAATHMVVEAIFWFHPLVWWIGSRMVEERERACDEEVLRMGCEPTDYVEGILKICRLYTESALPCVAGVTGADVKKRLRAILTGSIARELTAGKKLILAAMGLAVLLAPVVIGVLTAPVIQAQTAPANTPKFDVASIRVCSEPLNDGGPHSSPGRLATDCAQLLNLIGNAYNALADGHLNLNAEPTPITGGPPWIHTASYDINAKAEGNPSKEMMLGPMMQALLEDRFQLKIHRQTSEGPVYFLTVTRGGPKLPPFTEGSCTLYYGFPRPPLAPGQKYCERNISAVKPSVQADGATLDEFSKMLRMVVGRPVIDKTGIIGRFDIFVEFARERTELAAMRLKGPPPASDPTGPPEIFTAIQEQLGLRLESGRGPVDTLIIDHIEKPSEN